MNNCKYNATDIERYYMVIEDYMVYEKIIISNQWFSVIDQVDKQKNLEEIYTDVDFTKVKANTIIIPILMNNNQG